MGLTDKPLAAPGLCSYRYRGPHDWIMIGARDDEDALSEARRSLSRGDALISHLQKWDGERYVWCDPAQEDSQVRQITDSPILSRMMADQFYASHAALLRIDQVSSCAIRLALLQAYQAGALQDERLPEPGSHHSLVCGCLFGDEARETILEAWRYYGNTDRHLAQAQQAIFGESEYTSPWLRQDVSLSMQSVRWLVFSRFEPSDRLRVVSAYLDGANTQAEVPWATDLWDDGIPDEVQAALQDWKAMGHNEAAHALEELAREAAGQSCPASEVCNDEDALASSSPR